MSTFVLTDVGTWVGGYNLTCDTNSATLSVEVDDQETTTFCTNGWRSKVGGMREISCDLEGLWQAGDSQVDPEVFATLGDRNAPVTMSPTVSTAGSPAFMFLGGKFSYEMLGDLGDVTPFSVSMMGTEGAPGLLRGQVAVTKQDVSATGAVGSGLTDLSATDQVGSGQYLYATFHVFSAGTTITAKLQSATDSGFTSPTDRATIGPLTSAGGTWMTRVAGPITDTYYRFNITAITGTFNIGAAIAIA